MTSRISSRVLSHGIDSFYGLGHQQTRSLLCRIPASKRDVQTQHTLRGVLTILSDNIPRFRLLRVRTSHLALHGRHLCKSRLQRLVGHYYTRGQHLGCRNWILQLCQLVENDFEVPRSLATVFFNVAIFSTIDLFFAMNSYLTFKDLKYLSELSSATSTAFHAKAYTLAAAPVCRYRHFIQPSTELKQQLKIIQYQSVNKKPPYLHQ